ncbi:MAG: hypothetical protein ABFC34_04555 [Methanobacterium sp.]
MVFEEKIEEVKFDSLVLRDKFLEDLHKNVSKTSFSTYSIIEELKERLKKGEIF